MKPVPQLLYKSRFNLGRLELEKVVEGFEEIGAVDPLNVKSVRMAKDTLHKWVLGNTV